VRFTLTAGQKGDAPQAAALIEGLPAEVVMADTAYDADHLRQAIAAKGGTRRHSQQSIPCAQISARQASLCPTPSRGMLLLKAQAVQARRNTL
jgi:transposase